MRRIAMWSGPRNISTAMMRAWENRADTIVCDEPLYAYYLEHVPVDHPGREEIAAAHDADWRSVVRWLTEDESSGASIFYQKHMAHHLLPDIERQWLNQLTNCFLIRDPREMLASLSRKMGMPELRDTGLPQQVEIFDLVRRTTGRVPPVIDSADVLKDPRRVLSALCNAIDVPWNDAMLSWPAGRRETDGVWAKYWYDAVERSTGFEPFQAKHVDLEPGLLAVADQCRGYYETLAAHRIF
ncbi:MAG: HAD family hydrolase [Gemmatimonadota bacterium]